ncbi:uncharacterized protein LOC114520938 [Dendronephthya gigantea]|uniref:uncharacterized protein LOC114520938 n=1 Tax=Dendronephthya gigantea TaxID=151771 RepID=UPI001069B19E|nr:uncharacterized protein LOC114520938 [Dendronephthya gigantea]
MAAKPFSKEELNFFKFASIVHDEFPKMLRWTFVALWNSKIAPLPGYQVWDDSPAVRTLLSKREGGKTAIPTNDSFEEWDCTALFKATIYSKTFGISTTTTIKTLSDQFIKGKKPNPFHASLTSPTGNQDETISLAIDQVRLLRNHLCHSSASSITKPDFDDYVRLAKDAFTATGFSTDQIDYIGGLEEGDFPTERVSELIRAVLENRKFLEERVENRITAINSELENIKLNHEHVIKKLDRIEENAYKAPASRTECSATGEGNRGFEAIDVRTDGENKLKKEHEKNSMSPKIHNPSKDSESQIECCIPDKPKKFVGRNAIVEQIMFSLAKVGCGIVSIVGGPGFGKSTIAIEVSHQLSDKPHNIDVIFSFMSRAFTVSEVSKRLCGDIRGVNPGEDPESSLMYWLKGVQKRTVLVMDNIEQLLETDVKPEFVNFVLTLRKNSRQKLQILTTTRTEFSISGVTENYQVKELDEISSVELLKMYCPNEVEKPNYLSELANLCGFVPLALCITGTLIPDLDDPLELIQWLKEEPMETLRNCEQCVQQAIEFSFKKLSVEDQKGFVCLSVFDGNFQRKSAEEVIQKNGPKTQSFLRNLVSRSLIQSTSDKRFVIHSLIRRFLTGHKQYQNEKTMAQGLMVKHFLKMCHSLTIKCYSRDADDGFTSARESLKKDIHNVEETLKVCSQDQAANINPNASEFLAGSDIYKSSYRFFHNFSWDLLTEKVLINFSKACIKLAERLQQPIIKITFQYQIADQKGHGCGWKTTDQEYTNQVEIIKAAYHKNKALLKEDRHLYMSCNYLLVRYHYKKEKECLPVDLTEDDLTEDDLMEDDLPSLPEIKVLSTIKKAAETHALMKRGNLSKLRANKMFRVDREKYYKYMHIAESSYNQALSLAEELFGDHELTCALNKLLGDLFSNLHKNDEALTYYTHAINLYKRLKFDSNEQFVILLKNCGACLSYIYSFDESIAMLEDARDIAEKLAEKPTSCKALVYSQLAITSSSRKSDCPKAVEYAKKAIEMQEVLDWRYVETMKKIIKQSEENAVVQSIIDSLTEAGNVLATDVRPRLKSCIPDRNPKFTGRSSIIKQTKYSLVDAGCGIVSIVGGPGYGKTAVAVEVSHHLSKEHDIVVIFLYLSHASTVSEVRQSLYHSAGINPGEDPESSFMFWLKSIQEKVVLVMDNIEQLLEGKRKSQFIELVRTLRKNSQQRVQILTTTKTEFVIPSPNGINHQIEYLDEKSSVELLRKCCSSKEIEDTYLSELAKLCGFIPLALCIAGTLIPGLSDPSELIQLMQWLREEPSKGLRSSDQCILQAIELSFHNLSDEDQRALVCLSVFDGDFHTKYAEEVIGRSDLETLEFLKSLVCRGLVQEKSDNRFVIHSLIRQFLANHDQFQDEKIDAQVCMATHFLKMCDSLAMDYYSKNGYTCAIETLRKDTHNVERTLQICSQDQPNNLMPNLYELLTRSDIYKNPPSFFYNFSLDALSETILRSFFESCIKLAESRKQLAIVISFHCLLAYLEGRKSAWKSSEVVDRMEKIRSAFHENKAMLKEQWSLFLFCYYFLTRYDSNKATNAPPTDLSKLDFLTIPDLKASSISERVAEARIVIELGNLYKKRANNAIKEDRQKSDEYMNKAKSFYNQALSFARMSLDNHELTCILLKLHGDLFLNWHKNKQALECYTDAINRRKEIKIDSNKHFVFLLKNQGACLAYLHDYHESLKTLLEAYHVAKMISDKHSLTTQVYDELLKTWGHWKRTGK